MVSRRCALQIADAPSTVSSSELTYLSHDSLELASPASRIGATKRGIRASALGSPLLWCHCVDRDALQVQAATMDTHDLAHMTEAARVAQKSRRQNFKASTRRSVADDAKRKSHDVDY